MGALDGLEAWENFYFTLTGKLIYKYYPKYEDDPKHKRRSFVKFNEDYPGKILWKHIAEAVYLCGEEKVLNQLSSSMKSPEGRYKCFASHSLFSF